MRNLDHDRSADRVAWVDVDVAAIAENTRLMREIVGPRTQVMGLVKANGYGHDAVLAAQAMVQGGAAGLGVASVGEGLRLRMAGIDLPILMLGLAGQDDIEAGIRADLSFAVGSLEYAREVARAAQAQRRRARLQLKIDTGMHRMGVLPAALGAFLDAARDLRGVVWEGAFTHFATADEPARPEMLHQLDRFVQALAQAGRAGWRFPIVHAANSAASLWYPPARLDMVRAGIALYGVAPGAEPLPAGFRPALAFRTHIVRLADLPADSPISYSGIYITSGPARIATIPVGFADGFRRSPPWQQVLVRGQRVPVVGRICMDYAMIDVSGVPEAALGDVVTLLGPQGDENISAVEVAGWLDTSVYEVLTALLPRGRRLALPARAAEALPNVGVCDPH